MKVLKWLALSFVYMTRLPIKINFDVDDNDVSKTSIFFGITSLFVGAFMFLFYYLFSLLGFNIFAIIAALGAGVIITGALHIDGFIDCADAFFVSKSKQRALEILKDSRVGAYGAIAVVFLFLIKASLFYELASLQSNLMYAFFIMPVAAKVAVLTCAYFSKYPRENGSGKSIITLMKLSEMLISFLIILCILFYFYRITGLIIFASMIVLGLLYVMIGKRKIGGATGDVLGSANESGEILFLMIIFIFSNFGGMTF
jgi:adenosylcobinamide-GDP ribazoletransferase